MNRQSIFLYNNLIVSLIPPFSGTRKLGRILNNLVSLSFKSHLNHIKKVAYQDMVHNTDRFKVRLPDHAQNRS